MNGNSVFYWARYQPTDALRNFISSQLRAISFNLLRNGSQCILPSVVILDIIFLHILILFSFLRNVPVRIIGGMT